MPIRKDDYLTDPPVDFDNIIHEFTLPEVFAAAVGRNPDAIAITDQTRSMTWREWKVEVDAVACGLQAYGVGPGDVVAAQLPNCADFETLHLAVAAVGGVLLPIHVGNGDRDVLALLTRVAPAAVVLPEPTQDGDGPLRADALRSAVPSLRVVLVAGRVREELGVPSLERLRAAWLGHEPRPVHVRPDMPLLLLPSSGTTSARPKICMHSHQGLLSNTFTLVEEDWDAFTGDVVIACALTHLFGLQSMYSALFTSCGQALLDTWDPDRFFELADRIHPGIVFAVPTQLHDIVAGIRMSGRPAGLRPRQVRTAGAVLPAALIEGIRATLGARVIVIWGMSEIGYGTRTRACDPPDVATRSIGRPAPGSSVRVVDDEGNLCSPGVPGGLEYRGPGMFRGYFGDPHLTHASVSPEGWLRTGDMAALTEDGLVVFHGRAAELINVGGQKFNAGEIQDLLGGLAGLGPLAVVAKPDPRLGEYPCLVVTDLADGRLGLGEVTDFLHTLGVADYKIPVELTTVRELPRTPVGKINRRALEEMVAAVPAGDGDTVPPLGFEDALRLVEACVADVLGLDGGATVDPEATFRSLGVSSLLAVRLRNLLMTATGRSLPAALAFEFPSAVAIARMLSGQPDGEDDDVRPPAAAEPVAIIGMACRLPGGVSSPEDFWTLLAEETDAISGFPVDRGWGLDRLFAADPDHPGTSYVRAGGFLHDASGFDAGFFGFSEREALATDPQQRLLLEAAWETFEQARLDPAVLRGTRTGVFTGAMYHTYAANVVTGSGELEGLLSTGTAASALSGRISYTFGFEGPALTVDTACSSSLVALHLACQSLNSGESTLALAGGVTVMPTPASFVEFSRLRGLAPDGRCKSFGDAADGAGWSEGVGLLLLERLSDARRNGHRVLAVIRGSAVTQDGASNGLTAPNGRAQRRVIRRALADAGISPADVDAVEGHGTGTTLGDPIEADAIIATYGADRPDDRPLWLGSVKSNIGHAQAAAGVTGVIKMVLALKHARLPKTLHVDAPSSHVDWSRGTVQLLTEARPWPQEAGHTRRAGISSFGISGTNAHVIVEEAPEDDTERARPVGDWSAPWVLSARSEPALRAQARRLVAHLTADPTLSVQDVAYSLASDRTLHSHAAVVTGAGRAESMSALAALGEAGSAHPITRARAHPGRLAFVFTGQGSQRLGMGSGLAVAFPVFAAALDQVSEALDPLLDRQITSVMWAGPGTEEATLLDSTGYAQPALFAFEVALYRLLESWGIRPDHLVGHSIGEIAAAHVAGVLDLGDACALVAARSRLMQALPPGGAMLAVRVAEDEAGLWLAGRAETVAIASVNGPRSIVLSGAEAPLAELAEELHGAGVRTSRLTVSHAFHSPLMEPMLEEFRTAVGALTFAAPAVPLISDLTGRPLTEKEARDPAYWVRHVREPVRFRDAIDHLWYEGTDAYLEVGPDAALTPMIHECIEAGVRKSGWAVVPACDGERDEEQVVLAAVGRLHTHGVPVDWAKVLPLAGSVRLPTYAFQHRAYWLTATPAHAADGPLIDPVEDRPSPVAQLAGLDDHERDEALLTMVLEQVTAVLGGEIDTTETTRSFVELGITSVNAIELRNRLTIVTGVRMPSTLVFDHPTPAAVVRLVRDSVDGTAATPAHDVTELVADLERLLSAGAALDEATVQRLKAITAHHAHARTGTSEELDIDAATDEDLFRLMDSGAAQFGSAR